MVAAISGAMIPKSQDRTIRDFGNQWMRCPQNEGYSASMDFSKDICGPLLNISEIKGNKVLEIGSGTGRIVKMLLAAGAGKVIAAEPSEAYKKLIINSRSRMDKKNFIHGKGAEISEVNADIAFSIGVLHHIPDPQPTANKIDKCLRLGGKFLSRVYGIKGSEIYLKIFQPMWKMTSKLPDKILAGFAYLLNILPTTYIFFCKLFPFPFYRYIRNVFSKLDFKNRLLITFGQLNPVYAKYYSRQEAQILLRKSGFINIVNYHRHEYSWRVLGE